MMLRAVQIWLVGVTGVGLVLLLWGWWALALPMAGRAPITYLDADRQEIATSHGENGRVQIWVPLNQIPPSVVAAVVAAEDRRFMRHMGVDLLAVARAALTNAREASVVRGASTITQQLARGLFLNRERTWWRKVREVGIALALEVRYSKEQILEAYLNTVYLGHVRDSAVLGVAAGARHLLGKRLDTVGLDEAALLASAIRAPNRLSDESPALVRGRRDRVLDTMSRDGAASDADVRAAKARPVHAKGAVAATAPWFMELARDEVARRVVDRTHGGTVVTSLDRRLQDAAEASVRDRLGRAERSRRQVPKSLQAAVVAIEPATGRIRALVGGRRFADSEFNRATRARRQPGSLFKPFVYLAAFEVRAREITPATIVEDEPVVIPAVGGVWTPHNIDGRFHGPVTIRRALEDSLNVPAALVARHIGIAHVTRVARAAGINSPLAAVPSLSLGTSEVTLLEMTSAFATLANGGVRVWPTTLDDDTGALVLDPHPAPTRAVSAESAFLVTHLLRGVMRRGTASASAQWNLQEVTAGKTGTTDGLRDAWFVGYTPNLVVGVWVGADDGRSIGLAGADIALPIWADVMKKGLRPASSSQFAAPPGIVMASVDAATGLRACGTDTAISEAFRAGSEPEPCESLAQLPVARELGRWVRGLLQ